MVKFYKRLAKVPGIDYEPPQYIDGKSLKYFGKEPEKKDMWRYEDEPPTKRHRSSGYIEEYLYVNCLVTSEPPAKRHRSSPQKGESKTQHILRDAYERLELPGEAIDYHYIIQEAMESLWKLRLKDPSIIEEVVSLCYLNLQLVRTTALSNFSISLFPRLIHIYLREGALKEALEIAQLANKHGQKQIDVNNIKEMVKLIESEDFK